MEPCPFAGRLCMISGKLRELARRWCRLTGTAFIGGETVQTAQSPGVAHLLDPGAELGAKKKSGRKLPLTRIRPQIPASLSTCRRGQGRPAAPTDRARERYLCSAAPFGLPLKRFLGSRGRCNAS